jgi:hypothetical protein
LKADLTFLFPHKKSPFKRRGGDKNYFLRIYSLYPVVVLRERTHEETSEHISHLLCPSYLSD